jgi:hypothetical protein
MNCGLSAACPAVRTNASGGNSGGEVDLAGLPAPGASQESGLQPEFSPTPDALSLLPLAITLGVPPVLSFETAPLWPGLLRLAGNLLQGGEDVLAQVHPGSAVVSACGGGVDADQGQVHLTPLRGFRDQALQQGLEDAGVTPLTEAVVDGRPGAELLRHLPPLPAGPEPPDHALDLLPQPLGVRAVPADGQVRPDELPFEIRQLHSRHARRSTGPGPAVRAIPQIDHDAICALEPPRILQRLRGVLVA